MYPPSSSPTPSLPGFILIIASLTVGGLVRLWLSAYLSAPASEEEEEAEEEAEEEEGARVCVDMQRRGGFGVSCSFVVAVSARFGLLQVFIAAAERPMLCSAAGVDGTRCASSPRWEVRPCRAGHPFHPCPLPWTVRLCWVFLVSVQMAGCDHYSPVLGLTLNKDRYQ